MRGEEYTNLALLTDGLRAEREQGITIDVAYRYFATPQRKFIIADTPGHIQYTRNMVTGASTANVALILVDARKGVLEQSRRHAFLASLLRVPHLVLCINKMDLVDYDKGVYEKIRDDFRDFATKLDITDLTTIPMSALNGDNVVTRSENMPWYDGTSLLHHLEDLHIASDRNLIDVRFPVQYVVRPMSNAYHDYRGYAGQIAAGVLKPGDDVMVLGTGLTSKIKSIDTFDGSGRRGLPADVGHRPAHRRARHQPRRHAVPAGQPAARRAGHRRDDLLDERHRSATPGRDVRPQADHPLGARQGHLARLPGRRHLPAPQRGRRRSSSLNEIGRVKLRTTQPLFYDEYRRNRTTGSFILIDEATGTTVAAGMIHRS